MSKTQKKVDGIRLHVAIAHSGLCSRRKAEQYIEEGRVTVNGEFVVTQGLIVGPDDDIRVDEHPIRKAKQYTVLLNKPTGVVTTLHDPEGRPTIVRYLPDYGVQLKPVGRLDMETEGLLLVTNDGELAHRLTHPRYGVEKEYFVIVHGRPEDSAIKKLQKGVYVEDRKTSPAQVEVIHYETNTDTTSLKNVIHEGRKRQVRLMCEVVGHPVKALKRTRVAHLVLKGLRSGEARLLGKKDVDMLRELVGLEPS